MEQSESGSLQTLIAMSSSDRSDVDSEGSDTSHATVRIPRPDPQYVYYRLYTTTIAIPSKHPAFLGNSYVGRLRADSIAPPQTALLIKRRLCKVEDISDYSASTLFCSAASRSPTDDGDRVPILTPGGSGSDPQKPIELVIGKLSRREHLVINELSATCRSPRPQYIYYKLYAEDGEIPPKHPIYPRANDPPSPARIVNYFVPPPHTVNAIIRSISHAEGFSNNFWDQLFIDIASEKPMDDENVLILENGGPGATPERPLAFVRSGEMSKRGKLIRGAIFRNSQSGCSLHISAGNTLYTDGVARREAVPYGITETVYRVRTIAGEHGFVTADDVELI